MGMGGEWHPDPAGRYTHRWWTGEWTDKVAQDGTSFVDPIPWDQPSKDQVVVCAVCGMHARGDGACVRCGADLGAHRTFASKRHEPMSHEEFAERVGAALEEALASVDHALAHRQHLEAVGAMDEVAAHARVLLRVLPMLSTTRGAKKAGFLAAWVTGGFHASDLVIAPLAAALLVGFRRHKKRAAMADLENTVVVAQVRAIELLARTVEDETLGGNLLRRFAALYLPGEQLPEGDDAVEHWVVSRLGWAERELPELNAMIVDYAIAFRWRGVAAGLEQLGYRLGARSTRDGDPGDAASAPGGSMSRAEAARVLGVSVNATADELKAAYRREAAKYHPDKLGDVAPELRELAEARMKLINEAHDVLLAAAAAP
jgi:hypothetical protein